MKKSLAIALIFCYLFAALTIPASAEGVSIISATVNDGVLEVMLSENTNGMAKIEIANSETIVLSAEKEFNGNIVTYGLPVHQLPYAEYRITIKCQDSEGHLFDSTTITAELGEGTGEFGGETLSNILHASRAIMQPYATVYSDPSMSVKIANLKKYDYVHVLSEDGLTAKVSYRIQSGNGTTSKIDQTHAIYNSSDDVIGVGYIYTEAFKSPSINNEISDKQRDVVELAYSRLGTKGVYNQGLRLTDCYLDCAALASYCWYQLGYDFSDGGGTACSGIVSWAQGHNAVLWEAGTQPDISGQMLTTEQATGPEDFFDSETHEYNSDDFIIFTRTFDPNDFSALQPGDLIFFTYRIAVQSNDGTTFYTRLRNTYNHVVIFVGCKTNSAGDILSIQCIESSNADKNTHITTYAPNDMVQDISMIVRPTGCEIMQTGIIYGTPVDLGNWVSPLESYVITSEFGMRVHPISHEECFHNGLDMAAPSGTPIYAAYDGIVTTAGWSNAYGNYVRFSSAFGKSALVLCMGI